MQDGVDDPQWKPGDRANGHIRRLDGTWVPVPRRTRWDVVALVAAAILVRSSSYLRSAS